MDGQSFDTHTKMAGLLHCTSIDAKHTPPKANRLSDSSSMPTAISYSSALSLDVPRYASYWKFCVYTTTTTQYCSRVEQHKDTLQGIA